MLYRYLEDMAAVLQEQDHSRVSAAGVRILDRIHFQVDRVQCTAQHFLKKNVIIKMVMASSIAVCFPLFFSASLGMLCPAFQFPALRCRNAGLHSSWVHGSEVHVHTATGRHEIDEYLT